MQDRMGLGFVREDTGVIQSQRHSVDETYIMHRQEFEEIVHPGPYDPDAQWDQGLKTGPVTLAQTPRLGLGWGWQGAGDAWPN